MNLKKLNICAVLILFLSTLSFATYAEDDGHIIQLNTSFSSITGKPTWLIILRDIDNGANIPIMYDVRRGENSLVLPTPSHNYFILASVMHFAPYRYDINNNRYSERKINNFCGLESRGRIIRGESLIVNVSGRLTPNTNTFSCNVLKYR